MEKIITEIIGIFSILFLGFLYETGYNFSLIMEV